MIKIYTFLISLLFSQIMWSQEDICIGKKYTLYSDTLQEERAYWIHLPENYGKDERKVYPVIYLLDGDSFFHTLVGISKTLSGIKGQHLPSSIIVAILNTDRTRDLTPTSSAAGRDGKIAPDTKPVGGGSEKFNYFLTQELRDIVDKTYQTNGQNMLIGHSYAGLFTLNTFLRHTDLFDTYLAIDPSLWWDQGKLANEAKSLVEGRDFADKKLYIGVGSKKRTDRTDIHLNRVDYMLHEVLPQAQNLRFFYKSFADENHGTVSIPALYDGLKQLFER